MAAAFLKKKPAQSRLTPWCKFQAFKKINLKAADKPVLKQTLCKIACTCHRNKLNA